MSSKAERREIIDSDSSYRRHSLNQEVMKSRREGVRKAYGDKDKASKANLRRRKEEQLWQQQRGMQFHWALTHILEGRPALGHMRYIEEEWGRVLDTYTTEKGLEVTITIVDFTRQQKQ